MHFALPMPYHFGMGTSGRKAQPDGDGRYRLEWEREALKRLRRLPRNRQEQIRTKLQALAADPAGAQPQAAPVKGRPGVFRLRIGDWRATYEVHHAQRVVVVLEIGPGHDVY